MGDLLLVTGRDGHPARRKKLRVYVLPDVHAVYQRAVYVEDDRTHPVPIYHTQNYITGKGKMQSFEKRTCPRLEKRLESSGGSWYTVCKGDRHALLVKKKER